MKHERVQRGFDVLSTVYDLGVWLFFGNRLWVAQAHFFDRIPKDATVLILGGGNGKILSPLLPRPDLNVVYIDLSTAMIKRAQKQFTQHPTPTAQVIFHQGNESDADQFGPYDVIITPFVLDSFQTHDLIPAVKTLEQSLKTEGLWLFSDFKAAKSPWLITLLYAFFRWVCGLEGNQLPDFDQAFVAAGLAHRAQWVSKGGLFQSAVWQKPA